jgi:hypothetical protein
MFNVMVGYSSAPSLLDGSYNVLLGYQPGIIYDSSESNNIIINSPGIIADANTLRIGNGTGAMSPGDLNKSFIQGIRGITPSGGDGIPVYIDSSGQLGTVGTAASLQFDADSGSATSSAGVINIKANTSSLNAGSTVSFSASSSTVLLNVTDASFNTVIGKNAGNLTIAGSDNTIIGGASGFSLTNGSANTIVGEGALGFVTTGSRNTIIGQAAGSNYTSSESSNIIIGYAVPGTLGESNCLRIAGGTGTGPGQLNKAFISGIDGINVGSVATVVTESGNQLGTAVITAGTGITVTPSANTITIATSGIQNLSYTLVSTSPYTVLTTDEYISVDSSGGAITIRLPNAATLGRTYVIKDKTGSAATNNITVTTVGGIVTLDGATTFVMNTPYETINIIGDGSIYEIY